MRFPRIPLLLALASVLLPLRAATNLHLAEIGATRFVEPTPGAWVLQRGLLSATGAFRLTDESPVLASVVVPPEVRGKMMIQLEAWFAYQRLGSEALINFVADENSSTYTVGLRQYMTVAPSPNPLLSEGRLVNISTRGQASMAQKLIGGFIVDEQHRWVLIRAVGPGLASMGVTDAMADPYLTLYHGSMPFHYNGDWSTRPDAADIAKAAQRVGAFPLSPGSKDSALLVELPPGAYTAHIEPESGAGGTVLLEVYTLPAS